MRAEADSPLACPGQLGQHVPVLVHRRRFFTDAPQAELAQLLDEAGAEVELLRRARAALARLLGLRIEADVVQEPLHDAGPVEDEPRIVEGVHRMPRRYRRAPPAARISSCISV